MSGVYDYNDYDKNLNLKISSELWLVIAYLLRPYLAIISGIRMGRGGSKSLEGVDTVKRLLYPDDFSLVLGILATIPALLFIYAAMKRKPSAGDFVRSVWRNGVLLLSIAAAMNIVIVFVPVLIGTHAMIHLAGWIQIALSVVVLGYLHTSQRVRDTFADFPAAEED